MTATRHRPAWENARELFETYGAVAGELVPLALALDPVDLGWDLCR